jgi:hypothetical protein
LGYVPVSSNLGGAGGAFGGQTYGTGVGAATTGGTPIRDLLWHFLLMTYDGADLSIYCDGMLGYLGSYPYTSLNVRAGRLVLGGLWYGYMDSLWNGYIDSCMVWGSHCLTSGEAASVSAAGRNGFLGRGPLLNLRRKSVAAC